MNPFFQVILRFALTAFQIMAKMVNAVIDTKTKEIGLVKKMAGLDDPDTLI
jgi:hypothetical protein